MKEKNLNTLLITAKVVLIVLILIVLLNLMPIVDKLSTMNPLLLRIMMALCIVLTIKIDPILSLLVASFYLLVLYKGFNNSNDNVDNLDNDNFENKLSNMNSKIEFIPDRDVIREYETDKMVYDNEDLVQSEDMSVLMSNNVMQMEDKRYQELEKTQSNKF